MPLSLRFGTLSPLSILLAAATFACAPDRPAEPPAAARVCPAPPACPEPKAPAIAALAGVDAVSAKVVEHFNAGDAKALFASFDPRMREAIPEDKAKSVREQLFAAKGKILGVEKLQQGSSERTGLYRARAERGEWHLSVTIDSEGRIAGLFFKEPPAPAPPVAKSAAALGLPFAGQWLVAWGGDRVELNQHVDHPSQRRAADLLVADNAGKTHRGDGKKNEDYFAYGKEILAVADGVVHTVIDGVPENAPGEMNRYVAPGNEVILKHAEGSFSLYAHLIPGKIRVKVGQKVKRGAVLGSCGNSGNSSEPHLHFQLQDGPLFEKSWGIEPIFQDVPVTRDGKSEVMKEYTWLKGDRVGKAK
ncbi:MAG: peptidoglycan DD-metalloendopeptidase family protein [Polyangiaceae bacterium]|nr:peptidoglycan DD-metalloendopeptidase family protein [Polyangiaceae bacterium]MCL4752222.1 M23 family metallopeptidase [Myxococcales bacterium]